MLASCKSKYSLKGTVKYLGDKGSNNQEESSTRISSSVVKEGSREKVMEKH